MCEGRHPKPPHEVVGPVAPLTMAAWPHWCRRADVAQAVQMPAMKVAPLLDDPQAMQIIEVIGDDIEPLAETVVVDGTMAVRQCKLDEACEVSSDDASNDDAGAWQITDSEEEDRRGQRSPSPIPREGAEANCSEGSSQIRFVSHFSVGAPFSGTAHRGQVQAARGRQPGAEVSPRAQLPHQGFDDSQFDSQFDGGAWTLQCEHEGLAAESEDPYATPP